MIFRQLFDPESSTYTYIIADEETGEAAIIDSVNVQSARDEKLIRELGLKVKYLLETHVHADHITGVAELKKNFPEAKTVINSTSGAEYADIYVKDGEELSLGKNKIKVIATPGHTNGCTSYYTDGKVFTGDTLLIRGCGRSDFQEGSPEILFNSITMKLFTLPDETLIYPAHNYNGITCSSIREEKKYNPRLANKSKEEFVEIMNNLNLPYPKKFDEAVPANLKCGRV